MDCRISLNNPVSAVTRKCRRSERHRDSFRLDGTIPDPEPFGTGVTAAAAAALRYEPPLRSTGCGALPEPPSSRAGEVVRRSRGSVRHEPGTPSRSGRPGSVAANPECDPSRPRPCPAARDRQWLLGLPVSLPVPQPGARPGAPGHGLDVRSPRTGRRGSVRRRSLHAEPRRASRQDRADRAARTVSLRRGEPGWAVQSRNPDSPNGLSGHSRAPRQRAQAQPSAGHQVIYLARWVLRVRRRHQWQSPGQLDDLRQLLGPTFRQSAMPRRPGERERTRV
jgi:hypothetical protein